MCFSIGENRREKMLKIYKRDKMEELKNGKQYAELMSDSAELQGMLPWPRLLNKGRKQGFRNGLNSRLRKVEICMPDGNWLNMPFVVEKSKTTEGIYNAMKREIDHKNTTNVQLDIKAREREKSTSDSSADSSEVHFPDQNHRKLHLENFKQMQESSIAQGRPAPQTPPARDDDIEYLVSRSVFNLIDFNKVGNRLPLFNFKDFLRKYDFSLKNSS